MPAIIQYAQLEWSPAGQPRSLDYGDVYFSASGGLAESHHVFLLGNRLPERWQQLNGKRFHIGELGFGSGLNFLQSWKLWETTAPPDANLHYLAFELHPLEPQALQRVLNLWASLSPWSEKLRAVYPEPVPGLHRLQLSPRVTLDLYLGDVLQGLREYQPAFRRGIDCWFLDGFSPLCNARMWSLTTLRELRRHSNKGATLSSYSVAGTLRRSLTALGFRPEKLPGFAAKREMLYATLSNTTTDEGDQPDSRPWFQLSPVATTGKRVAVIGAGMAGCAVASRLVQRGFNVTVFDKAASLAAGASGNPQAILQCRLAANAAVVARYFLHAFLYARRHYAALENLHGLNWQPCGVLTLASDGTENSPQDYRRFYPASVLDYRDRSAASALAGIDLPSGGWWLPQGGWLEPTALCATYLQQAGINLQLQTEINGLCRDGNHWYLQTAGNKGFTADVVVIANSLGARNFAQTCDLPLTSVRGQLTRLQASTDSGRLQTIIAGSKSLLPATRGQHCLMASYQRNNWDCSVQTADDRENLSGLHRLLPDLDITEMPVSGARASLRCASPDQLPVVGPVPDQEQMTRIYSGLQRNARARITAAPAYHPGLYVSVAHGSYGLSTSPLAAEYLAALINNESLPLTRSVGDALHPARFLIRRLKRQQAGRS